MLTDTIADTGLLVAMTLGVAPAEFDRWAGGDKATPDTQRATGWIGRGLDLLQVVVVLGLITAVSLGCIATATGHLTIWERLGLDIGFVLGAAGVFIVAVRRIRPLVTKRRAVAVLVSLTCVTIFMVGAVAIVAAARKTRTIAGPSFPIYGLRLAGAPGLRQRSGPGPQYRVVGRLLRENQRVVILCTVQGGPIPGFSSSRTWDYTAQHTYIADSWVDRPRNGAPPYIPQCPR